MNAAGGEQAPEAEPDPGSDLQPVGFGVGDLHGETPAAVDVDHRLHHRR